MIVVSDTTPLISLLKIGHLDLLKDLFDSVILPQSVLDELTVNQEFYEEAQTVKDADYITVEPASDQNEIATFGKAVGLDRGESEAILLSEKLSADVLLMDEVKGRQVARQMNIHIMGCIGILIVAFKNGYLSRSEAEESIEVLRKSGRHISDRLYNILRNEIGD